MADCTCQPIYAGNQLLDVALCDSCEGEMYRDRVRRELAEEAAPAVAKALRDHFDATSETSGSLVTSRRYIGVELGEFTVFVELNIIHKDDPPSV